MDDFTPEPVLDDRRPGASRATTVAVLVTIAVMMLVLVSRRADSVDAPLEPTMYDDGSYTFLAVQIYDKQIPVSYNQCRPLRVVMNPQGAPPEAEEVLELAMEDIRRATGFEVVYDGLTAERPGPNHRSGPILVAWTDVEEVPEMNSHVAGLGGSSYPRFEGQRAYYLTGRILLSEPVFDRLHRYGQQDRMRAILDHEFGHVVGLDHVEDPKELMARSGSEVLRFGHGDLTGLAKLGTQPC